MGTRRKSAEFRLVGGDGQGGAVELVGQEEVAARNALGQRADGVGEGDGLLVDHQPFESEGHGESISPCPESRKEKVDRRRSLVAGGRRCAHQGVSLFLLSTFSSLLLYCHFAAIGASGVETDTRPGNDLALMFSWAAGQIEDVGPAEFRS